MPVEVILGAIGKSGAAYARSKTTAWFKSHEASKELAILAATAIEAGIAKVPLLTEELRSDSFKTGILVPVLEILVADPSHLPDPERLADQYVAIFVERFSGRDGVDKTLARMFHTSSADLKNAFIAILTELRSQFYQSKYWKELAHLVTTETTFRNTEKIISILSRNDINREVDTIDLPTARLDAKIGSEGAS